MFFQYIIQLTPAPDPPDVFPHLFHTVFITDGSDSDLLDMHYFLTEDDEFLACIFHSWEKEDIHDNALYVHRSIRRHQKLNDDLTFGKTEFTIEERIKGNQTEGFHSIPLTPQAQKIVDETMQLYPAGEYFYSCKTDSRFIATTLYEGGVKINQLSTFLRHSDTRTIFHYIRQKKADQQTSQLMCDILEA